MTSSPQLSLLDAGDHASSGKTSSESSQRLTTPSAVSWERLSEQMMPCVRRLNADGGLTQVWLLDPSAAPRGLLRTLNISAWPNDGSACLLSSILETGPIPQRYYLSARAARGIIRRAVRRGKSLPPELLAPLVAVRFGARLPRLLRILASAFPRLQTPWGGASQSGGFRTTDLDNNGAFIPEVAWALQERDAKGADSDTKEGHLIPVAICIHADAIGRTGAAKTPSPDAEGRVRLRDAGMGVAEEASFSLTATAPHAVAMNLRGRDGGAMPEIDDKASLRAADGGSSRSYVAFHGTQDPDVSGDIAPPLGTNGGQETALAYGWAVRRLTPVEAARLQGFPDDHAAIPPPGKNRAPDGPQYKAYGNSMAVPAIRWICQRIERERLSFKRGEKRDD